MRTGHDISAVKRALGKSRECPTVRELSVWVGGGMELTRRVRIRGHVRACRRCRAELALLEEFESAAVRAGEAEDVSWIEQRITRPALGRGGWWRRWLSMPRIRSFALITAGALIAVAAGLQVRRPAEPALSPGVAAQEPMRSGQVAVIEPSGDLAEPPAQLSWMAVPGAAGYRVRIEAVDRTTLWAAPTPATRIALPAAIRAQLLPGKTVLWGVAGLDASGRTLAESALIRFRVTNLRGSK